ncbi:MAG: hypothetical protein WEB93_04145 [Sphingomonadales bacterium]
MIVRIVGWMFFFLAFIAAGAELLLSVNEGAYMPLTLAVLWQQAHPDSFIAAERLFVGTPLAWLWDPALLFVLKCPSWIPPAVIAALCLLGRRDKRRRSRISL